MTDSDGSSRDPQQFVRVTAFDDTLINAGFTVLHLTDGKGQSTDLGVSEYILYLQADPIHAIHQGATSKDLSWMRETSSAKEEVKDMLGCVYCGGYYSNLRLYKKDGQGKWVDVSAEYLEEQSIRPLDPSARVFEEEE